MFGSTVARRLAHSIREPRSTRATFIFNPVWGVDKPGPDNSVTLCGSGAVTELLSGGGGSQDVTFLTCVHLRAAQAAHSLRQLRHWRLM